MNQNNEAWQRVALMLGWNTWDLNVENQELAELRKQLKKEKAKKKNKKKKKKWKK